MVIENISEVALLRSSRIVLHAKEYAPSALSFVTFSFTELSQRDLERELRYRLYSRFDVSIRIILLLLTRNKIVASTLKLLKKKNLPLLLP